VCIPSAFSSNVGLLGLPSYEVVVSELSEVELLSPLSSSGHWSGPCLLCGRWSLEAALRNDVRRVICWRVPDVSRLCFTKYCQRASFGSHLILLGDGAAHLYHDTRSLRHFGVATSFYPTRASRWVGNG
jgi:hypothetical protein